MPRRSSPAADRRPRLCQPGQEHADPGPELVHPLLDLGVEPFATHEEFCRTPQPFGLGYRKEDIDAIMGERKAAARERSRQAAEATTGETLSQGNPTGSNQDGPKQEMGNLPVSSQPDRAAKSGIGERTRRELDRLARDFPERHGRVKAGSLSVNGAWIAAGLGRRMVRVPDDPEGAARGL